MKQRANDDPSKPLPVQRLEKFARMVAAGESDLVAYQKSHKCPRPSAIKNAWRLREREGIANRIQFLQQKAADITLLDMKERRTFMARAVRINLATFDPVKDGDLIEEITEDADGKKRYKLPSKRACAMDDAKLAGELLEKIDHTSDGQVLPSVAPQIIIQTGPHWSKPRTG